MKQTMTVGLVVLALAGAASCAGGRGLQGHEGSGRDSREARSGIGSLPLQERVVLRLRMDEGMCKIDQRTPPDIRTQSNATITWLFIGACDRPVTVAISENLEGAPETLFDLTHKDTRLSAMAPVNEKGPPMRLTGKLKDRLVKGRYKYQVLIDGEPAYFNPEASRGDFLACPFWPCGDFQLY
jgi:hypothetical protein